MRLMASPDTIIVNITVSALSSDRLFCGHTHKFYDFLVISVQAILSVLCFVEYLPNLHMNLTLGKLRTGDGASMARSISFGRLPARAV